MGFAIPVTKIDRKDYVSLVKTIADQALQLGSKTIPVKELVIRTLTPKDLGLTTDEWSFTVNAGENTIVNTKLDDKTLIVIYGIFNLSSSPVTVRLKFGTNAVTKEDVDVQDMYVYDYKATMLAEPIVFQPGSQVVIKAVTMSTTTAGTKERLGFLGFVVEQAGRNIGGSS
ncbi:MAG: hypothetical protein LZ173_02160 [Thaumarchaeota archaeon]|jgi:hypothetical protein|nr:hypothetical protein [Candidatus Geocrenenecus arthurdayi]